MTTGVQIFDDFGLTQIDSEYRGLVLKETITLTPRTGPPVISLADFGEGPQIPREPIPTLSAWAWFDSSTRWSKHARAAVRLTNQWQWMDFVRDRLFIAPFPTPPANATFSVYAVVATSGTPIPPVVDIYDVPSGTDAGFGFQVFTAQGESAFYSNDEHMRVVKWVESFAPNYAKFGLNWANKYSFDTHTMPMAGSFSVSMTQDCYGSDNPANDQGDVCRSFFRQRFNNSIEICPGELYTLSNDQAYNFRPRFSTLVIRQGVA